jgi:UDP-GlcNAc:undecaprenyl-phosphate/decaprenyl-phosphate GlcNAc-1-phosphate transferase
VDDLRPLKPYAKLVMQVAAASVLPLAGLVLPWTHIPILNDLITLFWMVGITNAVNLLDNMDGLAGGVAVLACVSLAVNFMANGQNAAAAVPLILACAVAGFLVFNFSPASIFMGDCGALFLGFMLGGTALLNNWGRSRELAGMLMTPVLIMLVPILDTSLVTITRIRRGQPVSQGGRDHVSHRLVAVGLSERRAVILLYGLTVISGGMAFVLRFLHAQVLYLVIPCFALVVLFFALHLGMIRPYEEDKLQSANLFSFLYEFSYKRRILEVLFDVVLMTLAYYGAFLLRYGGMIQGQQLHIFEHFVPIVFGVETLAFLIGGIYRGLWRYVGIEDVIVIVQCVVLASLAAASVILVVQDHPHLSISVLILNSILLLLLVGGSRVALRLFAAWLHSQRATKNAKSRVLIYGAGVRGDLLVRQILSQGTHLPVGFLDDDWTKAGRRLHGINIYNPSDFQKVVRNNVVTEVLISSTRIPEERARELGVAFRWVLDGDHLQPNHHLLVPANKEIV